MAQRIRFVAPASLLALLALARGADAQPRRPQIQPAQTAAQVATLTEARRAYDQGTMHFAMGRYAEALTEFRRAYELQANPVVLVPIIECEQALHHTGAAIRALEQYLAANPPGADRAGREQQLVALRARPTVLHVTSDPPGAVIVLDGQPGSQVTPAELAVSPGAHTVTVQLQGYESPVPRSLDAVQGESVDAQISLARGAPPEPVVPPPLVIVPLVVSPVQTPHPRGTSPTVYVAGAVAGAGLIAGTVFGLMALSARSDYQNGPTRELYDTGRRSALLSDIGFGAALLSAGIAVVVYIADRTPSEGAPAVQPARAARAYGPRWTATATGLGVSF